MPQGKGQSTKSTASPTSGTRIGREDRRIGARLSAPHPYPPAMHTPHRTRVSVLAATLFAAALLGLSGGCGQGSSGPNRDQEPLERVRESQVKPTGLSGVLEVGVTYRERMMLPAGSTLRVVLQDVSKADAPAVEIAAESKSLEGGPPFNVELRYDAAKIENRNTYAVRATIEHDGKVLFTSDTHTPVLTRGAPMGKVEVVVRKG